MKNTKTVNPYFLDDLMSPIAELADDDEASIFYSYVNPANEEHYRAIIRDLLLEYYNKLNDSKKEKVKLALRYYLSKRDSDFERVFNANLLPFAPPNNPKDFFL